MRKNEYGAKKGSGNQSSGRGRSDIESGRANKPNRTSKSNSGSSKRNTRGQYSAPGDRDDSYETRKYRKDESFSRPKRNADSNEGGYRRSNRSTDSNEGGYRRSNRSTDSNEGGYRNSNRRSDSNEGGYRNSNRRSDSNEGGYRNSNRRSDSNEGGYRKPNRRSDSAETGYNRVKRGFRNSESSGNAKFADQGGRKPRRGEYRDTREPGNKAVINNMNEKVQSESNMDREDRVEGRNSVFEAIRSGRPLNKLFVLKDSNDIMTSRIIAMAREKDIPIQYFERAKLDAISQTRTHQGVILEVAAKEYVEVEDILKIAEEKGEKPFLLVLDGITDTNNLGSIIRSAECAGVHGIILPKRRSATLNATVAKVAAGALEYMPVARVSNLVQSLRNLKNQGIWIIGADMDGQGDYHNTDLTGPSALVIGSEGEGLSRLVKEECDLMVKIPMKGKISSLNAGVAAALVMFEILRQRDK